MQFMASSHLLVKQSFKLRKKHQTVFYITFHNKYFAQNHLIYSLLSVSTLQSLYLATSPFYREALAGVQPESLPQSYCDEPAL